MNGTLNFLVPIPIPISVSTVTVQAQDSGMTCLVQPIAVLLAVLIGGYINYRLQGLSFKKQNEIDQMNRRIDAYTNLLNNIPEYRNMAIFLDYVPQYLNDIVWWGSSDAKAAVLDLLVAVGYHKRECLNEPLGKLERIVRGELCAESSKSRCWWQFWK